MTPLAEFLQGLVWQGRAIVREPPGASGGVDRDASSLLSRAYADYRLQVAGPVVDFDAEMALAAAKLVYHACWFLVDYQSLPAELEKTLTMPSEPRSPGQHLSADLVLRFLAQVHRRALAQRPDDVLHALLERVLRHWPLSGVLATVDEGPLVPLDFGGHPGLLLLYAERWCLTEKPAWLPKERGLEYLTMVWEDLGKDASLLPTTEEAIGQKREKDQE